MKSALLSRLCFVAFVLFPLLQASAQNDQTGFPAFSSLDRNVNLNNLNFHLEIPVVNRKGRGLPFAFNLTYDSTMYWISTPSASFMIGNPTWGANPSIYGWTTSGPGGFVNSIQQNCGNGVVNGGFYFSDSHGTVHPFPINVSTSTDPSCGSSQATALAVDQSGYVLNADANAGDTVLDSSGTKYTATSMVDANGNKISFTQSVSPTQTLTNYTDTLGATPLKISSTTDPTGAHTLSTTYSYATPGGGTGSLVVNHKIYPGVASGFGCPRVAEYGVFSEGPPNGPQPGVSLVDNIVLESGDKYTFTYEPTPTSSPSFQAGAVTGRLASIGLPTGGTVTFGYPGPNGGINCSDGTALQLTLTTSDGTRTYTRMIISSQDQRTIATDGQGNQTYVFFQPLRNPMTGASGWVESGRNISQSSGGPLIMVQSCFNNQQQTLCPAPVSLPITQISTTSTPQNGGVWGKTKQTDTFLDSNTGLVTEVDEHDFMTSNGAGGLIPGPVLRKALTSYTVLGNNIHKPQKITVCSPGGSDSDCAGSGTKISQQTFGYDESTPTPTSGLPQHEAVSGFRGNMTSSHQWINTSGSTADTVNVVDDAGNLLTTTDPGGHKTSTTYDPVAGCGGAFPTQVTLPDTNSPGLAHHKTSATYDCSVGLLSTSTDQNGGITSYHYDNMFRVTEVDLPGGGQTVTSYPDLNHVIVKQKIDSSRSTSSTTVLDGYWRVSRTSTANGESTPYDQQDSCYDGNGRLSFRSYPYQGSAPNNGATCPNASLAGDSFAYDGLGRPTKVTHSDGTSVTTSYSGWASQITDEGNGTSSVSRITQKDALGRLAAVCEVYNGAALLGSGGAPGNCGLDIAGIGFLTTYSYDMLSNLTAITQGTLAPRTYAYDSLSRMTSESTPEAGTASYSYNNDSLLMQRVRPQANQVNPSVTTTTTYSYDQLHRLTQRSYSDSTGVGASFNYDETSAWGTTLAKTTGRESSESVGNAGQIFSYDSMGRIVLNAQCTPRTCGSSAYNLNYSYDLLGDITSSTNGVGVTFTNTYNIAGRLTGMTSSLADAQHPATLLSNVRYSPSVITETLGNGVAETTNFSPRGEVASYLGMPPNGQPGTGLVTTGGTLKTYQQQTQAGTQGVGWVAIYGSERGYRSCYYTYGYRNCNIIWDDGWVSVTVNGFTVGIGYGQGSDVYILTDQMAGGFNSNPNSPVTASVSSSGDTIILTAKNVGAITNYSLSVDSGTNDPPDFGNPSFAVAASGATLTGGSDPVFITLYDNGSTTITVNNHPDSYAWSGSSTSAASIAQGLCNAINNDSGAFVTANTNGLQKQCPLGSTTVNLVSKQNGQNYSLTASSSSVVNSFSLACLGFPSCASASLIGGGNAAYSYSLVHAPDGQVTSALDFVNGNWTFAYDPFNRLASSSKNSGQQTFSYLYDRYGNRWQQNAPQGGPSAQYVVDNNNRLSTGGVTYDAAGHELTDGLGNTFSWDAEGRLVQVRQGGTVAASYVYDAGGRRVHGPNGEYVYDVAGNMITQLNLNGGWSYGEIYATGRHLATYSGSTTNFFLADWLGTKRVMTALDGTTSLTCTGFPFGDGVNCSGTSWTYNGFTDDVHDPETNLEHTLYRKYSSSQGRWLTPDPMGTNSADPNTPQTWNRYAYVMNNPLMGTDPTGLECVWDDGSFDAADDPETGSVGGCQTRGGTWIELGLNGLWSDQSIDKLRQVVSDIAKNIYGNGTMVTTIGLDGTPYVTFFDTQGRVSTTVFGGTITNYAYFEDEVRPYGDPRTAPDPGGAIAQGVRAWSVAHPGLPLDPYERDLLLGAEKIDFMSSHPLGVDTKERICNGAFILGAAQFGTGVAADLTEAELTVAQKWALKGLGGGSLALGLSGFCSK